jgi:uncharacterized membrane protein HdeD (DUF308 family)
MFFSPLTRATFITILFGFSVIFEGISMLLLSFKLKKAGEAAVVVAVETMDIPPIGHE